MNGLHARDENSCLSIHNSHRLLPITVATVTATVIVSGRVPIIAARRIIKIVAVAEIVAGMPVVIPDVVPAIVDAAVAATVVVATVVAAVLAFLGAASSAAKLALISMFRESC